MKVCEAITWDGIQDELYSYLGLPVAPAAADALRLQAWLEAAVEAADAYLERDFLPLHVRWVIQAGVGAGDVYLVSVRLEDEDDLASATRIASAGETPTDIAVDLREYLEDALAAQLATVGGQGPAIEVSSDDLATNLVYASNYTKVGGTSGIVQTVTWDTLPSRVKVGVLEYVKALRAVMARTPGVIRAKTAQFEEQYADQYAHKQAFGAARGWWSSLKERPWLDG